MSMVEIRPYTAEDYQAISRILNQVYPDHPQTPEEIAEEDRTHGPNAAFERWVATDGDDVIGLYTRCHDMWDFDAGGYLFFVEIDKGHMHKGIGAQLYDHMIKRLPVSERTRLFTWIRESNKRGRAFVEERGFSISLREAVSQLDLTTWDGTVFEEKERDLAREGIKVHTLRELYEMPDYAARLYDMEREAALDVPGTTSVPDFDTWKKETLERSTLLPDGFFIAVHGDTYVGTSYLAKAASSDTFHIEFTGVRRAYRGKGIATVLKARGMAYAKAAGCPKIETCNEVNNSSILDINIALGFKRVPGWFRYEKTW